MCGHQEGDDALRQVAGAIRTGMSGRSGFAARFGGEEFAVVERCDSTRAAELAEALRSSVEMLAIDHPGSRTRVVTVSVGVATRWPSGVGEERLLMKEADQALYAGKRARRNVVTTFPESHSPMRRSA